MAIGGMSDLTIPEEDPPRRHPVQCAADYCRIYDHDYQPYNDGRFCIVCGVEETSEK